ncbi:MAG TPA: hypothetical protein VG938_15335 [Verrucomicrobiae bacterium]|jgi:hypothetical protein|nr:hypothetical protein [Verrucomicrobiae bacterium]
MTNVSSNSAVVPDTLRDIKPPVEFPNIWLWIGIGAVALLLLALVVGLILYFMMRRKNVPVTPPVPAHVRAKHKLQEALELIAQPKPFCTLVSDTVRFYLEERFTFRAPERTTEEFLHELQNTNLLLPDQKESLGEFLKSCDLVKFARYEPREIELRELHGSAVRLVEETEPVQPKPESGNPHGGNERPEELVNRKS